MKKIMSLMLIVILVLMTTVGCGSKDSNTSSNNESKSSSLPTEESEQQKQAEVSPSIENEVLPGTELSTYMNNYINAKTYAWDEMIKKFEEDKNESYVFGALAFAFIDLMIIDISFYDTLITLEGDTYRGNFLFSDIEAWKKIKGNMIEFGYDYIYTEDSMQSKKGDREVGNGKYDIKAGTVVYERFNERNGKKISNYIVEINQNSEKSYSAQIHVLSEGSDKVEAYYIWFEDKEIMMVSAEGSSSGDSLLKSSILGRKNMNIEEMTKGVTVSSKLGYMNGKAIFEQ